METGRTCHPLLKVAEEARDHGHDVWAAAIWEANTETPIAICRRCGGWTRGISHSQVKLRRECRPPTRKGAEVWRRVQQGKHPHTSATHGTTTELAPWPPGLAGVPDTLDKE